MCVMLAYFHHFMLLKSIQKSPKINVIPYTREDGIVCQHRNKLIILFLTPKELVLYSLKY